MAGEDDNNSTFYLNLDASDFMSGVGEAKDVLSKLGESDSLSGLVDGLETAGLAVGALGAAFLAVKFTFDEVLDAERIKQTGEQFNVLATQSGVYADTLKKGLEEASKGWVDETTLMDAANKAMVQLQGGVQKLPEIMDLARKATIVMGGDVVDNFNMITQAIASGRTQTLKMHGLVVDQATVYRDYANSIGTTVAALSQAGKQEAMMNAVLKVGQQQFANVNDEARKNTDLWIQFKAVIKDVGDVIALAFDNIAGSAMARFFGAMKTSLEGAKTWLTAEFGVGAEKAAAQVDILKEKIADTTQKLDDIKNKKGFASTLTAGEAAIQTQMLTTQLAKYNAELAKTQEENKGVLDQENAKVEAQRKAADASKGVDKKDPIKEAQEEAAQQKALAQLDDQLTKEKISNMGSVIEANKLYDQQLKQQGQVIDAQINEIKAKAQQGVITQQQANDQIVKLNQLKNLKIERDDSQLYKMQEQALDNYKSHAETVYDGIARAFQSMSLKNQHALKDFGAQGDQVTQTFGSHMTNAFQQMGSGAKTGTQALSDAMNGMIGDIAAHYGQMLMLASIWPPNPAEFAAGAALEMLAGYLGSSSSSSSALTPGSAATGTSGAPGTLNNPANPTGGTSLASQTNGPSQVNLIIQGHMFGTDETNRWLVDQVRNCADATDFKITSIGGGI